jgi:hypothetical protein
LLFLDLGASLVGHFNIDSASRMAMFFPFFELTMRAGAMMQEFQVAVDAAGVICG